MSMPKHEYNKSHAHRIVVNPTKQTDAFEFSKNWKRDFLSRRENQWLSDIPDEYILDRFNTYGLQDEFSNFQMCCDIILGKMAPTTLTLNQAKDLKAQLPSVYGMIHARYIMSPDGLNSINNKYNIHAYGTCPRLYCLDEPLLPIGLSSKLNEGKVKTFCPCCREVFEPRPKNDLDGAFFGPNMAHIFIDEMKIVNKRQKFRSYQHTAFGFRVRSSLFSNEDLTDDE